MRLRATTQIRNDHMVKARKERGLSQGRLAILAGVSTVFIQKLEALTYPKIERDEDIGMIADILLLDAKQIMPPELWGKNITDKIIQIAEIDTEKLLAFDTRTKQRLLVASPDELLENEAKNLQLAEAIKGLSYREREIIKLRYGISDGYTYTLEEVGRIFKVTRERVRAVEVRAIRKLKQCPHLREKDEQA